jgi:hypothetical protein
MGNTANEYDAKINSELRMHQEKQGVKKTKIFTGVRG